MATTDPSAAVALSDVLANPTPPAVGAYLLGWDASTSQWVRIQAPSGRVKTQDNIGGTFNSVDTTNDIVVIPVDTSGTPLWVANASFDGAGWARVRTPNIFKSIASTSVTAGSPVAGWTPASGKKFRLMGYALSLSVAGSVVLQDATTEKIRTPLMPAGIGQPSPAMGNGILSAAANNSLNLDVTATGTVSGFLFGTEE